MNGSTSSVYRIPGGAKERDETCHQKPLKDSEPEMGVSNG